MAYSEKFQRAFNWSILGWEAVYKNGVVVAECVKGDPGGTTKYGIDQRDHPSVDVRNLTLGEAQNIFYWGTRDLHNHLEGGEWTRIRGDELDDDWALALFDCCVNPGFVSIHWAQEIAGVKSDGVIGPVSIKAINAAGDGALKTLLLKRDIYYNTRGSWADKFRAGWRNRNNALKKELGFA